MLGRKLGQFHRWRRDATGSSLWLLLLSLAILAGSVAFALLSPGSHLRLSPSKPVAIFIGDSYAAGAGASAPERRWTSLVANAEGWAEQNFAYGGTGYATTSGPAGCGEDFCPDYLGALERALDQVPAPAFIVVSGGRNDLGAPDRDAAVARFFAEACARKGAATLIVVTPLWQDEKRPNSLGGMTDQVRRHGGRCGVVLDLGSPLDGTPVTLAPDRVHPNDRGHQAIAIDFQAALRSQ